MVQKGVRYRCRNGRAPTEGWSGASHDGICPLFLNHAESSGLILPIITKRSRIANLPVEIGWKSARVPSGVGSPWLASDHAGALQSNKLDILTN